MNPAVSASIATDGRRRLKDMTSAMNRAEVLFRVTAGGEWQMADGSEVQEHAASTGTGAIEVGAPVWRVESLAAGEYPQAKRKGGNGSPRQHRMAQAEVRARELHENAHHREHQAGDDHPDDVHATAPKKNPDGPKDKTQPRRAKAAGAALQGVR